jgi:hypothetical protein
LRILRHTQRLQGPACIERIAAFEQIGHRQRATQHRRPVLLRCGQVDQRAVFIGGPLRARLLLGLFGDLLDLAQSGGIARAFTGCLSPSSVRASSLLRGISATSVSTSLRACLTVATSCSTSAFCAATASSAACVASATACRPNLSEKKITLAVTSVPNSPINSVNSIANQFCWAWSSSISRSALSRARC